MELYEFEYRGHVFGGETPLTITQIDGLLDLPDVESGDMPLLHRHGSHPGRDILGTRTITITAELYVADEHEFSEWIGLLRRLTMVGPPEPLRFSVPAVNGGAASTVWARPRRRSIPLTWSAYHRAPTVLLEFSCPDPRIYSEEEHTAGGVPSISIGGLTFPVVDEPIEFNESRDGGYFQCVQLGSSSAPSSIRFDGPLSNPTLTNLTTGSELRIRTDLTSADFLVVDSLHRVVLLNGEIPRYELVEGAMPDMDLLPGINDFNFRADSATGQVTVVWQHTSI